MTSLIKSYFWRIEEISKASQCHKSSQVKATFENGVDKFRFVLDQCRFHKIGQFTECELFITSQDKHLGNIQSIPHESKSHILEIFFWMRFLLKFQLKILSIQNLILKMSFLNNGKVYHL